WKTGAVHGETSGLLQVRPVTVSNRSNLQIQIESRVATVKNRIIRADFFKRDPIRCARELIGAALVWGKCAGKIVETEAYLAENDEACHTFSRPTARAFIETNKAGAAYIYFSYGAHWMLNVLVKGETNGFV